MQALQNGQTSPFECAIIDDWYLAVKDGHSQLFYDILNVPSRKKLSAINTLRACVFFKVY